MVVAAARRQPMIIALARTQKLGPVLGVERGALYPPHHATHAAPRCDRGDARGLSTARTPAAWARARDARGRVELAPGAPRAAPGPGRRPDLPRPLPQVREVVAVDKRNRHVRAVDVDAGRLEREQLLVDRRKAATNGRLGLPVKEASNCKAILLLNRREGNGHLMRPSLPTPRARAAPGGARAALETPRAARRRRAAARASLPTTSSNRSSARATATASQTSSSARAMASTATS